MTEEFKVVLRNFHQDRDQAFIYSSWRNQSYYSALVKPAGNPKRFFKEQSYKIRDILDHALVKIACLEHEPIVIVGYSVSTGSHLDWIYVKEEFRRKGIGRLLFPKDIETVTSQLTKIGSFIAKEKNLKLKGEFYANTNSDNQETSQESYREDRGPSNIC